MKAADPDAVFFGGYYAAAGRLSKQLRDAGVTATFVFGDGVLDPGFIEAGGDAAEGAIITCPCAPIDKIEAWRGLRHRLQGRVRRRTRHLLGRGLRRRQHLPAASRPATPDRDDAQRRTSSTESYAGHHQDVKFDEQRRGRRRAIYVSKVKDGKIVSVGLIQ